MLRRINVHDRRLRFAILALIAAITLPVAWYLGSPLFLNRTINEDFPTAGMIKAQPQTDAAPMNAPTPAAPSSGQPGIVAVQSTVQPTAAPQPTPTAAPTEAVPIALSSGQFGKISQLHQASGTATIYKLADGQRVLRLENFNVQNGPNLYVYLSGNPAPRSSDQLHENGAFEVARLKANIGNQNYTLPSDLDLSKFKSVVIYCRQFSVVFSTAELVAGS